MEPTNVSFHARYLMNHHGLGHWIFQFDRAKERAGRCSHSKKIISLSYFFIQNNTFEDIHDTILHEIAHALAGPGNGHNYHWKQICIRIGAEPKRCYGAHVSMPKGNWMGKCGNCGKEFTRHRKPKINSFYCTKCGPDLGTFSYSKGVSLV